MKFVLFLVIILSAVPVSAQTNKWFPHGLNIQPFTSNFLEPKAGFSYLLSRSEIRLDIGTSADIFHKYSSNSVLSFGADLFTYTRLRGEKDFHFPVETIDYLFGINSGYKVIDGENEYGFRFRLSHISAHLVDGAFDTGTDDWRNGRNPRVYSREFIELMPFYRFESLRLYGGVTYLFHTSPDVFGKFIYQLGFDYFYTGFADQNIYPFAAYDFKLSELNKLTGNNIISAGIKIGNYKEKGVTIYFSRYSGKSVHGEYFDINESYSTLGINVDI